MHDGREVAGRRGRRARAAKPGGHARLLGHARGDRGGARRPTAGCAPATSCTANAGRAPTRSSAARRRSSAAAARTSRPPRSRRRSARHPDVHRGGGDRRAVRALRGGDEGVRRRRRPDDADLAAIREARGRACSRRSRCRATSRPWPSCPHTPTGRVAKHELPRERTAAEIDFDSRVRSADERRATGSAPTSARPTPTRSPSAGATWRASSWAR